MAKILSALNDYMFPQVRYYKYTTKTWPQQHCRKFQEIDLIKSGGWETANPFSNPS
jgi:hypothetical protein